MKRRVYHFALAGLISVLLVGMVCTVRSSERAPVHPKELPGSIAQQYAKLPMSFEPNKGQFDSGFAFGSRGRGYALFLKPASATLILRTLSESNPSTLTLRFLKGNERAEVRGAQPLQGVANYFRGASKYWITDVPTYEKVRVAGIYPGIDAVYYGNQNHFEYDLVIKPGATPERIDIGFEGASDLTLTDDGDLVIALGEQTVQQPKPAIYQETNGSRSYVSGHYILRGKDRVGFQIGQYDHSKPLVIDPQLVYSVFGRTDTFVEAIGVDSSGNAYITGETDDPFDNNRTDVYAAKINAAGTAFVWTNFFGAARVDDIATGIAVDQSGNVYVTGGTSGGVPAAPPEQNFPTINPIQPTSFTFDAFVTKFTTAGAMVYSTTLGGLGVDYSRGIAVDSLGNMYVTGLTASADFPVSRPLQSTNKGNNDIFVSVLNATGSAFIFSTYVGGTGSDLAIAIAVDASGNAYITGATSSRDFPTFDPIQPAFSNGDWDAFVFKLNPSGSAFQYSSYLGGSGTDSASGIAVDSSGNAYVAGATDSINFPTVRPFQATLLGGTDAFVTKINASGSALSYSTYLGSHDSDGGGGITVTADGNAVVAGSTASTDFPQIRSLQSFTGVRDAFVTEFAPDGASLIYSTLLGGSQGSISFPSALSFVHGVAMDSDGSIYIVGRTTAVDFPITSNPAGYEFEVGNPDFRSMAPFITKLTDVSSTPISWTRVEQSNAAVQYTGDWFTNTNANHSAGSAVLSLINSSATFSFSGTGVRWIGLRDPWSGIADIYVDGVFKESVDTYSASTQYQVVLFEATGLPAGNHTLKIQPTGRRNAAAFAAWIWVDAFESATGGGGNENPDFTISVAPSAQSGVQGSTRTYTVSIAPLRGFEGTVSLAVTGFGSGANGVFTPPTITGSGSSTLTVTLTETAQTGAFTLTSIGSSGSLRHSTTATLDVSPATLTWRRVEQDNAAIQYVGDWFRNVSLNHSGGAAYLSLLNSSATFSFSGTGVRWIGLKDPWAGIARVYVDGQVSQSVDTYSSVTQYQQILFSITGLAPGSHTLKIETTGQRNPAAFSAWTWIDALEWLSDSGSPDFGFTVTPTTATVVQGESTAYKVTVTRFNNFAGNISVAVSGFGAGASGAFNPPVITQNESTLTVTTTSAAQTGAFTLTITLSSGALIHSSPVTLNVNPGGGAPVWTRVEQNDPAIQYTGDWFVNTSANHSGGNAYLSLINSSATFSFSGSSVRWIGLRDPWSGIANIYVDGVLKATVDTFSSVTQYQQVLYTITGLSPGNHTLRIQSTGQRNPAAFSAWIWVDAFERAN